MLLNVLAVFLDVIERHNLESLFIYDGGVNRFLLSEVNFTGVFAIINHWVFPICKYLNCTWIVMLTSRERIMRNRRCEISFGFIYGMSIV